MFSLSNSEDSVDVKSSYKLQPQILRNNLLSLNKKSLQTAVQLWEINGNNLILAMTMHNVAFFESEKLGAWKLNCQCWKVWDCEDQEVFNQCVRLILERGRKPWKDKTLQNVIAQQRWRKVDVSV